MLDYEAWLNGLDPGIQQRDTINRHRQFSTNTGGFLPSVSSLIVLKEPCTLLKSTSQWSILPHNDVNLKPKDLANLDATPQEENPGENLGLLSYLKSTQTQFERGEGNGVVDQARLFKSFGCVGLLQGNLLVLGGKWRAFALFPFPHQTQSCLPSPWAVWQWGRIHPGPPSVSSGPAQLHLGRLLGRAAWALHAAGRKQDDCLQVAVRASAFQEGEI